jgi:hypothetical protein
MATKPKSKPAPKKATPAKKPAPAKKAPPPRKAKYTDDMAIKVLAKENPYREGSKKAEQFALLKSGMTVRDFIKKGGTRGRLSAMVKFGRISVA